MKDSAKIELLYFDGCPNVEPVKRLLDEIMESLGITSEIENIEVIDNESAVRNHFLGSPSIRVNGKDIETDEGPDTQYSMRCRIYRTAGGHSGLPSKELLRKALRVRMGVS